MHSERTLVELVGLVYEAAGDPAQWTTFLERLGQVLKTPWSFFFVHDFAQRQVDLRAQAGFDPAYQRSYEDYYAARNPTLTFRRDLMRPGLVCPTQTLCPEDVFLKSEFHNDWAMPQRLGQGVNATVLQTPSLVGVFGALQPFGRLVLNEGDLALVRELMPHLQRAVRLHSKIVDLHALQAGAKDALDRWSVGVMLLDRRGRVLLMNRPAERLVARADGLSAGPDGLRASRASETARLRALIRDAATKDPRAVGDPAGVIGLSRSGAQRPLHLLVATLTAQRALLGAPGAACIVFVSDPDAEPESDGRLLARLYGLTATEARVAALLARGRDVKSIADELRMSPHTARTHLKRAFAKTGARRQADLVSLILRLPTSLHLK